MHSLRRGDTKVAHSQGRLLLARREGITGKRPDDIDYVHVSFRDQMCTRGPAPQLVSELRELQPNLLGVFWQGSPTHTADEHGDDGRKQARMQHTGPVSGECVGKQATGNLPVQFGRVGETGEEGGLKILQEYLSADVWL